MTNIGPKTPEKEYAGYLNKYVIITILPQGAMHYGKLKSFENRKAVFNPYRGDRLNNGKLENCLLSGDTTVEFIGLNIKIEGTSRELIEKFCELETMNNLVRENELIEKYNRIINNSKS